MAQKQRIAFEFVCEDLPGQANLLLGVQEGKQVVQDVSADLEQVVFRFWLDVQFDPQSTKPNFTGPYAQGTPANRFVYLCWGERHDGVWTTFRRAKVPLGGLSADVVHGAIATGQPLRANIRMSDAHGEAVAASLKDGQVAWQPLR